MKILFLALLLLFYGCTTTTLIQPPPPSQIYKYSVQMDIIIEQGQYLSGAAAQLMDKADTETQQLLQVLSSTHYYQMKAVEVLIGQGRFEEADVYIKSINKILVVIAKILLEEQKKQLSGA